MLLYFYCDHKVNNLSIFCFDFKDPAAPTDEKKDVETKKLLTVSPSE